MKLDEADRVNDLNHEDAEIEDLLDKLEAVLKSSELQALQNLRKKANAFSDLFALADEQNDRIRVLENELEETKARE